jgi:hypothetical protein
VQKSAFYFIVRVTRTRKIRAAQPGRVPKNNTPLEESQTGESISKKKAVDRDK